MTDTDNNPWEPGTPILPGHPLYAQVVGWKIIEEALTEMALPVSAADRISRALISRLAKHDPPILLCTGDEITAAEDRDVTLLDYVEILHALGATGPPETASDRLRAYKAWFREEMPDGTLRLAPIDDSGRRWQIDLDEYGQGSKIVTITVDPPPPEVLAAFTGKDPDHAPVP